MLSSSGDMSRRVGFDADGDFMAVALLTTAAGAAGANAAAAAAAALAVAGGKATAVAAGEKEMYLGRLPPARAVTRTMAPAAADADVAGAVTRSRPEVDIDSGDDGGVSV